MTTRRHTRRRCAGPQAGPAVRRGRGFRGEVGLEGGAVPRELLRRHVRHHLPVADENGTLIGLISATDIFMAVEEAGWEEQKE